MEFLKKNALKFLKEAEDSFERREYNLDVLY